MPIPFRNLGTQSQLTFVPGIEVFFRTQAYPRACQLDREQKRTCYVGISLDDSLEAFLIESFC